MGSSLGPFLANIIMTEMEKNIIKKFIDGKILLFYGGYVNNISVVIKRKHLKLVCGAQNNFDKNCTFTLDAFDNAVPHFLDIEISFRWIKYLLGRQIQDNTLVITVIPMALQNILDFFPYTPSCQYL